MAIWTYAQIIAEADTMVPNASSLDDKCGWLNEVNALFFEVVQIPQAATFNTSPADATVILGGLGGPSPVKARKIDRVTVGLTNYHDFLYSDVPPGQAYFVTDDSQATTRLTLDPNPSAVKKGIVRYFKTATVPITVASYASTPLEAPGEYGWIYVLGLAERVAKAVPDVGLANNYAADFSRQLIIAKQSFQNAMKQPPA